MPRVSLTGNDAGAEAMRQINPDVVPAYPITPQTELMHKFADFVADGEVETEMILVESEHSAMSAAVGASAAGARTMIATSSQGFALMHEVLYIAAGNRLPIVMADVNRALSAPINIHCDHSDTMGSRDAGWVQIFCENSQEVYDSLIMAIPLAEDRKIRIPVMINYDGFIISHTNQVLDTLEDEQVKKFVGEYKPQHFLLNLANPVTFGPLDLQDYYFEHRRQLAEAMKRVPEKLLKIAKEYSAISKREYGLFEKYKLDDAEIAMIVLGSTAGTAKEVVDQYRANGVKLGLLRVRLFRPFPAKEIVEALKNVKAIAVLDRSDSLSNQGGPVFIEIKAALYGKNIPIANYIYGLGGRDIEPKQINTVANDLIHITKEGPAQMVHYLGVRE
jgi:pyruvate ferredoxin oxidoreductase alpha subunit